MNLSCADVGRPSDQQLGQRLSRGEINALAELFSIHRPQLGQMIRFQLDARLASRVDVDDILQEAYLAAACRVRHFDGRREASAIGWVRLIVRQTLIDVHRRHLKSKKRDANRERSLFFRRSQQADSNSPTLQLSGHLTTPSQAAIRDENSDRVATALQQLSPIDQEILVLRHFEERSNQEIAELLGIEQKAASIRYVRAIRRLKAVLEQTERAATRQPSAS